LIARIGNAPSDFPNTALAYSVTCGGMRSKIVA